MSKNKKFLTALLTCATCACIGIGATNALAKSDISMPTAVAEETAKEVPANVTVYDITEIGMPTIAVAPTYYKCGQLPATENVAVKFNYTFTGAEDYVRINIASTSDIDAMGANQMKLMLYKSFIGFSYLDWDGFVGDNYSINFVNGTTYEFEVGYFDDNNDGKDTWYCKLDGEIVLWYDTADLTNVTLSKGNNFAVFSSVGVSQFSTTIKAAEAKVVEMVDALGKDYEILNGSKTFDVGVTDDYTVKTRIYLGTGYNVSFFLNTDGNGCNGQPFGGATSFRLMAGTEVQWGWPGAWHITNAGTWYGKTLEAGNTYDLEFGIKSIDGTTYNAFVSIDGDVWEFAASTNDPVFHGGYGTKVGISGNAVILEKSTATCEHSFAWTEPDTNDKMDYKCECGIVLDSKVLHTLPDNIKVYDWDEISTGYTPGATGNTFNVGEIPQKDNVAIEFNYTFTPCGDYVRFNIACTDSAYAFQDNTIKLMMYDTFFGFSYLDWSGFIGEKYNHSLVSGNTYQIQVGCFDDDGDGYDTWYCTVDGEIVLWLNLANHPELSIAKGDYVAVYTTAGMDKFAPVTVNPQTELDISDMGVDYIVVSGNEAWELGVDKYYTLKTRIYLQAGYDVIFYLNTDGTGANDSPYGGATSIRLKDGVEVQWGWPGAWSITNAGTWYGKTLESGKSYDVELGIQNVIDGTYKVFLSIDGSVWEFKATTNDALFHGAYGTKLGVSAANAVLFEKSTATCEHNVVDANKLVGCQRIGKACSVCDITLDFAWEHDYVSNAAVAPTCDTDGNIAYSQCSRCSQMINAEGTVITSVVDEKLGHDYQLQEEVSATCTSEGVAMHYTCSRCSKLFDTDEAKTEISEPAPINKSAHNMTHYEAVAATCVASGTIEFWQCSLCSNFYSDADGLTEVAEENLETTLASHNYGEWIPQVDATVDVEGTYGHYHCEVCGKNFDEDFAEMQSIVIPKLPNDSSSDDTSTDSNDSSVDSNDSPVDSNGSSVNSGSNDTASSGCFGSVGSLSLGVVAMGIAALFLKKKKED